VTGYLSFWANLGPWGQLGISSTHKLLSEICKSIACLSVFHGVFTRYSKRPAPL